MCDRISRMKRRLNREIQEPALKYQKSNEEVVCRREYYEKCQMALWIVIERDGIITSDNEKYELGVKISELFPHLQQKVIKSLMAYEGSKRANYMTFQRCEVIMNFIISSVEFECSRVQQSMEKSSPYGHNSGRGLALSAYEHAGFSGDLFNLFFSIHDGNCYEKIIHDAHQLRPESVLYTAIAHGTLKNVEDIIDTVFEKGLPGEILYHALEVACICKNKSEKIFAVVKNGVENLHNMIIPDIERSLALLCADAAIHETIENLDSIKLLLELTPHKIITAHCMDRKLLVDYYENKRQSSRSNAILSTFYKVTEDEYIGSDLKPSNCIDNETMYFEIDPILSCIFGVIRTMTSFVQNAFLTCKNRVEISILVSDLLNHIGHEHLFLESTVWSVLNHLVMTENVTRIESVLSHSDIAHKKKCDNGNGLWKFDPKDAVDLVIFVTRELFYPDFQEPRDGYLRFGSVMQLFLTSLTNICGITPLDLAEHFIDDFRHTYNVNVLRYIFTEFTKCAIAKKLSMKKLFGTYATVFKKYDNLACINACVIIMEEIWSNCFEDHANNFKDFLRIIHKIKQDFKCRGTVERSDWSELLLELKNMFTC
jgi:hypothetical protein